MRTSSLSLLTAGFILALTSCGTDATTDAQKANNNTEGKTVTDKQKDNIGEMVENGLYKIINDKSSVGWKAAKVSGEHFGSVSISQGDLEVKADLLADAEIIIDMSTITVDDMEGEYADKLRGHLHSEDFFNTAMYPTAAFNLSGVKYLDGQYQATGMMRIKDTTGPVTFPLTFAPGENGSIYITGTAVIDRTKYGIQYGSGQFFEDLGDKMIYDEFELKFSLAAEPRS